jgi:hypothetical protein
MQTKAVQFMNLETGCAVLEKHVDPEQEPEFSPTYPPRPGLEGPGFAHFPRSRISPGPQRYRAGYRMVFPATLIDRTR